MIKQNSAIKNLFTSTPDIDGYDFYFGPTHPGSGNFGVKLKLQW